MSSVSDVEGELTTEDIEGSGRDLRKGFSNERDLDLTFAPVCLGDGRGCVAREGDGGARLKHCFSAVGVEGESKRDGTVLEGLSTDWRSSCGDISSGFRGSSSRSSRRMSGSGAKRILRPLAA